MANAFCWRFPSSRAGDGRRDARPGHGRAQLADGFEEEVAFLPPSKETTKNTKKTTKFTKLFSLEKEFFVSFVVIFVSFVVYFVSSKIICT